MSSAKTNMPHKEWQSDEIETIDSCPICNATDKSLLHADIPDDVCKGNPGTWSLWRCGKCAAAYLNPRPKAQSIGKAYSFYYTHQADPISEKNQSESLKMIIRKKVDLRRRISDDMLFREFGMDRSGRLPFSGWLTRYFSDLGDRERWDVRHLPPPKEKGARLLDVGSGNGSFLSVAKSLGYDAWGLEPDPLAVEFSKNQGFNVSQGTLPDSNLQPGTFEHVTVSHVLEHMHFPVAAMKEIFALLKPGGRLWLTTPNLDSIGHKTFERNWRGLESPRHICIYTQRTLFKLLSDVGFVKQQGVRTLAEAKSYFDRSYDIAKLNDTGEGLEATRAKLPTLISNANASARSDFTSGESLLVVAYKP
jgi:2-polyprenyl-3-methyl-5-hydroxy-6-metoxy-1,4-benzoquinol methylase